MTCEHYKLRNKKGSLQCFTAFYAFHLGKNLWKKDLIRKNLMPTRENAPVDEKSISIQLLSDFYFFIPKEKRLLLTT
jgi:hypothetical protein